MSAMNDAETVLAAVRQQSNHPMWQAAIDNALLALDANEGAVQYDRRTEGGVTFIRSRFIEKGSWSDWPEETQGDGLTPTP